MAIKLLKNNTTFKARTDFEWVEEFYKYMQGETPENISGDPMNLSSEQAYDIVWYLKEHFSLLPDNIFKCDVCQELFDADCSGMYSENGDEFGRYHFCTGCDHLCPNDELED